MAARSVAIGWKIYSRTVSLDMFAVLPVFAGDLLDAPPGMAPEQVQDCCGWPRRQARWRRHLAGCFRLVPPVPGVAPV